MRDHRGRTPVEPGGVRSAHFQFPDAAPDRPESARGLGLVVTGQVPGLAQCQMHCLVEVLAGLAVTLDHLVGDHFGQEGPQLIPEGPVFLGELDVGEVHQDTVTLLSSFVNMTGRRRSSSRRAPPMKAATPANTRNPSKLLVVTNIRLSTDRKSVV